jgi:hypothetical protein
MNITTKKAAGEIVKADSPFPFLFVETFPTVEKVVVIYSNGKPGLRVKISDLPALLEVLQWVVATYPQEQATYNE